MDKDYRYVVHDVTSQYPDLVSSSVGEMDDRHVVIYKRGCQPPDVEIYVSKTELRGKPGARRPAASASQGGPKFNITADMDGLVTLNTQKKDRRTIEELHRDGEDRSHATEGKAKKAKHEE